MMVSNIPWHMFVLGPICFSEISEIISKVNFFHPKTEIPRWNEYFYYFIVNKISW